MLWIKRKERKNKLLDICKIKQSRSDDRKKSVKSSEKWLLEWASDCSEASFRLIDNHAVLTPLFLLLLLLHECADVTSLVAAQSYSWQRFSATTDAADVLNPMNFVGRSSVEHAHWSLILQSPASRSAIVLVNVSGRRADLAPAELRRRSCRFFIEHKARRRSATSAVYCCFRCDCSSILIQQIWCQLRILYNFRVIGSSWSVLSYCWLEGIFSATVC